MLEVVMDDDRTLQCSSDSEVVNVSDVGDLAFDNWARYDITRRIVEDAFP